MSGRRALVWFGPLALGLVFGLLFVERYTAVQIFDGEDAVMFSRVLGWLDGTGPTPWRTGPIGPLPFHHGPMYYWVLAPLLAISSDPLFVRIGFVSLQLVAACLLFAGLCRVAHWSIGLLCVLAMLSSSFYFEVSRQLWHASLLPVFVCGALYFTIRLANDGTRRDGMFAAALAAIALQLHVTSVTYAALVAGVAIARRRTLGWRAVGAIALVGWIAALPIQLGALQTLREGYALPPGTLNAPAVLGPAGSVGFLLHHLAPAWDGPLSDVLAVLWPVALVVGLFAALRERRPTELVMVAGIAIGLVIEIRLLAHDDAPRYLHANIYCCFLLLALGADWLHRRLPPLTRALPIATAVLAALVAFEALRADVPPTDWPAVTAGDQRALAKTVAPALPGLEHGPRIHGAYLTDQQRLVGLSYMHRAFAPAGAAAIPDGAEILVAEQTAHLEPNTAEVLSVHRVDRPFTVTVYRPSIRVLEVEGPAADLILNRWSMDGIVLDEPATHTITVEAAKQGPIHVLVRSVHDNDCPLDVRAHGRTLPAANGPTVGGGQLPTRRFQLDRAATVTIKVGPCRVPPRLDVF